MSLTNDEKTNILKGRDLIDNYRKNHADVKGEERNKDFFKLLNALKELNFGDEKEYPFNSFFKKSELYNTEESGVWK